MLSLLALEKTNHQPPPSRLCSLSREPPLLQVLAAACISAQDAQMGLGAPGHCSHVGIEGSKCPTAGPKKVTATSAGISTPWTGTQSLPIQGHPCCYWRLIFSKTTHRKLALSLITQSKVYSRGKTIPLSPSEQPILVQFTGPGSTAGRTLGRRLWQPLCPAQASCALQWYLKPLLKAAMPKAVLAPRIMTPWVDTVTQQQIPVYLQISYPAGAICLSVVTYHPASMGRACRVSSVLGLLFHTLCCAWAIPAAAGWMGTAQEASGWASLHQHCAHGTCALLDLPFTGTLSPLKLRGAGTTQVHLAPQNHQALTFDQQQNTHHIHTQTYRTHKLGMTWVLLVLNEGHFLLCAAKASGSWHHILHGDSLLCQGKAIPHFIHSGRAISS